MIPDRLTYNPATGKILCGDMEVGEVFPVLYEGDCDDLGGLFASAPGLAKELADVRAELAAMTKDRDELDLRNKALFRAGELIAEHAELKKQLAAMTERAEAAERSICDEAEKLMAGTLHVGYCNADHGKPVGCPGCSCTLGRTIHRVRAEASQLRSQLAEATRQIAEVRRAIEEGDGDAESMLDWLNGMADTFSDGIEEWIRDNPKRIVFLACRWLARIQYALAPSPVASAAASGGVAPSRTERFEKLVAEWKRERNSFSSDPAELCGTPAYKAIIAMGPSVVPLILDELRTSPDHWFVALDALTGASPITEEHAGHFDKMVADWLAWGVSRGLIQADDPAPAVPAPQNTAAASEPQAGYCPTCGSREGVHGGCNCGRLKAWAPEQVAKPAPPEHPAFKCPECGADCFEHDDELLCASASCNWKKERPDFQCPKCGSSKCYHSFPRGHDVSCVDCGWSGTWAEVEAAKGKGGQDQKAWLICKPDGIPYANSGVYPSRERACLKLSYGETPRAFVPESDLAATRATLRKCGLFLSDLKWAIAKGRQMPAVEQIEALHDAVDAALATQPQHPAHDPLRATAGEE